MRVHRIAFLVAALPVVCLAASRGFAELGSSDSRGGIEVAREASRDRSRAPSEAQIERLRARMIQAYTSGSNAEALGLALQYVPMVEQRYGSDHEFFAYALGVTGRLLESQGRFTEAEDYVERAKSITDRVLPPGHIERARCAARSRC